jgi:uncharacterized membrane protein YfcA
MFRPSVLALLLAMVAAAGARPALAGGESSRDSGSGTILSVDPEGRTAVFRPVGSGPDRVLRIPDGMDPAGLEIGRRLLVSTRTSDGVETLTATTRMFLAMSARHLAALLVVGFLGGLLSGFIGSGGAFVLTPSMMSLGVPAAVAVASNMCHKFPKALVGAYQRNKYGHVDIKLGLMLGVSAVVGVQLGVDAQRWVMRSWGSAGSNLYVSLVFVVVLVLVGAYVFRDAWRLARGGAKPGPARLARFLQRVRIPPMVHFKTAGVTMSFWVTVPLGAATGLLAATIAVGGFIGVPGMIYLLGATATVASATELVVAFVMGLWASVQWGLGGFIDVRLAALLLATSLVGVQLGAMGTTYVRDHAIKVVMGTVMLIVAVSRGAKVPVYLADLGWLSPGRGTIAVLNGISFWTLVAALAAAGVLIAGATMRGIRRARRAEQAGAPRPPEAEDDLQD